MAVALAEQKATIDGLNIVIEDIGVKRTLTPALLTAVLHSAYILFLKEEAAHGEDHVATLLRKNRRGTISEVPSELLNLLNDDLNPGQMFRAMKAHYSQSSNAPSTEALLRYSDILADFNTATRSEHLFFSEQAQIYGHQIMQQSLNQVSNATERPNFEHQLLQAASQVLTNTTEILH